MISPKRACPEPVEGWEWENDYWLKKIGYI